MSVTAMQNFRGVPGVTPQGVEAVFGKVDVQGTGLVDTFELADALRVMGKSERDIQQLLKELVAPFPQPYSHNADVHDVLDVKSTGLVDKQELTDAWREMGITERENQQLLDELNLEQRKKICDLAFTSTIFSQRQRACGRFERYCAEIERHAFPDCNYLCVGTAHSALGTAEVAASSDTVRQKNVST